MTSLEIVVERRELTLQSGCLIHVEFHLVDELGLAGKEGLKLVHHS